jgi:hypothetical protein
MGRVIVPVLIHRLEDVQERTIRVSRWNRGLDPASFRSVSIGGDLHVLREEIPLRGCEGMLRRPAFPNAIERRRRRLEHFVSCRRSVHRDRVSFDHEEGRFGDRDGSTELVGEHALVAFQQRQFRVRSNRNDLVARFFFTRDMTVDLPRRCA